MPRPNIDVFGHCIMCGVALMETKVINGIEQTVFKGNKGEVSYLLDDGSRMRVSMCKKCVESLDGTEADYVMKSVIRGWQHELETYPCVAWPQEKKDAYMDKYGKMKIVVRSDNKNDETVQKFYEDHKKKAEKVKPKKKKKVKEK